MLERFRVLDAQLRTRGRMTAGLLASLLLLAIAVPAALSMDDDDEDTAAAPTTSTTRPATSTTVRPTSTTSEGSMTTGAGSATTTTVGRTATTPAPPATQQPASTTTTLAPVRCGADAFTISTVTDKESYRRDEVIKITSTVTNTSSTPCAIPSYTFIWRVENEAGTTVSPEAATVADFIREPLAPGQRYTTSPTWDPLVCQPSGACTRAPAGTYTVVATWNVSSPAPGPSRASFRLEA
jgi:hypothetical protein